MTQPVHHTGLHQGSRQDKDRAEDDDDFIGEARENLLRGQDPEERQSGQKEKRDQVDGQPFQQEQAQRRRQQEKQDQNLERHQSPVGLFHVPNSQHGQIV